MRITAVQAVLYQSRSAPKRPSWLGDTVIANPMSMYPRYHDRRSSWMASFPGVLVRVQTDDGVVGLGTATGGRAAATLINEHYSQLLVGEDPTDIERLWDQLYRASLPYGRRGLPIMAISGIDAALWDVLGKAANAPVYRLLGGATRDDFPIYQTTMDPADWKELQGVGVKLAIPFGPSDGKDGLAKNRQLVKECRDTVGPDKEIMLDCYMAWDVEYTRRMIDLVEPIGVRWIEEPLPPDDYHGYEQLGRIDSPVSVATGEHEYTRWGFTTLIGTGGVTILQPDVGWVGGISEARRICHLASSYHLTVIPHAGGNQAAALHLIKSQVNTPLAEWIQAGDRVNGRPEPVLVGLPDPDAGRLRPSDQPGLGLALGTAFEEIE